MAEEEFIRAKLIYDSAKMLNGTGTADDILSLLEQALRLDPEMTEAWIFRGDVFASTGMTREAVQCYHQAIQIDPSFARVLKDKVTGECDYFEVSDAEACFSRALEVGIRFGRDAEEADEKVAVSAVKRYSAEEEREEEEIPPTSGVSRTK